MKSIACSRVATVYTSPSTVLMSTPPFLADRCLDGTPLDGLEPAQALAQLAQARPRPAVLGLRVRRRLVHAVEVAAGDAVQVGVGDEAQGRFRPLLERAR